MSQDNSHDRALYTAVRAFVRADIRRQRRKWPKRTDAQMFIMADELCRYNITAELSRCRVKRRI